MEGASDANDAATLKTFPAAVPFNLPSTCNFEEDLKTYRKTKLLFLLSLTHDDKAVIQSGLPIEINELTESFVVGKKSEITLLDVLHLKKASQTSSSFKYDSLQKQPLNIQGSTEGQPKVIGHLEKVNNNQKIDNVKTEKEESIPATDKLKLSGALNTERIDEINFNLQTCIIDNNDKLDFKSSHSETIPNATVKSGINRKQFRWERLSLWKSLVSKVTPFDKKEDEDKREDITSLLKNKRTNRITPIVTSSNLAKEFALYSKTKTKNDDTNLAPLPVSSSLHKPSEQLSAIKVEKDVNGKQVPSLNETTLVKSFISNEISATTALENKLVNSLPEKPKKAKKKKKGRSSSSSSEDLESLEKRSEARLGRR